jgi:LmbE family N-acetylglucosaminyl deacetylase
MKILFVVAHPDDEVYGPYGTIARMVQEGNEVMVLCLCTGKRPNANQEVSKNRIETFISNCQNLNVEYELWDNDDLDLTLNETAHKLTKFISLNKPEIVYTHNISDINHDHQIAAESTIIACRPKPECSVNELYFFEVPSSTDWSFSQIQPTFQPNRYVDIGDYISIKQLALSKYTTETYEYPDARSVEAMTTLSKYRGYQVGFKYAEAFQLVFSRYHRNQ